MNKENIKDAAEIVNNILDQPLDIPNAPSDISLLKAALKFNQNDPNDDLYKVIQSFVDHPENTKALITEMELLIADLKKEK